MHGLAQLGLEGLDLRGQRLHLLCLRRNRLGLRCNQRLDLADVARHCIGSNRGRRRQG